MASTPNLKNLPPSRVLIARAIGLMTRRERLWSLGLLALMMASGFLESMVVATVLPFVYILVDPERAAAIPALRRAMDHIGLDIATSLPVLSIGLIAVLVAASAMSILTTLVNEKQTEASRNRMAREMLERAIGASYAWVCQQKIMVLANIIYDDVRVWRRDCVQSLMNCLQSVILIVFPAAAAIALAPLHGFYALVALAVIAAAAMALIRRPLQRYSEQARLTQKRTLAVLSQTLSGIREVKTSNRTHVFVDAFDRIHRINTGYIVKTRVLSIIPANLMTLFGQIGFILTALLLWKAGYTGAEITAQIAVIGIVVSRVLPAANRLNTAQTTLLRGLPFVHGMLEVMDGASRERGWLAERGPDKAPLSRDWQSLRLDGVEFAFPSTDAGVHGLDIAFERGKFYGVVGRSGAGKSTLMNLLLGLLAPTGGRILIDDAPREGLSPSDWLDQLAYVPQDVFILDDTVATNVAFGGTPADAEARMQTALRVACLDAVLANLPEGLETRLGERGRRFSGGQAQRVAIARAVFNRPSILLMDEATSALDHITEEQVQHHIRTLEGDPLVIAVAHRVSSLRACDAILVMDGGRIVDVGTYGELLTRCPLFAELAAQPEESRA